MISNEFDMFQDRQRSNWVRLRTLVTLRWFAISGQIGATIVATQLYEVQIALGAATLTIVASVIANLYFSLFYPMNTRLSERQASGALGFDILQLGLMLFLTGGLSNPFSVLLLAPVTIAATVLHLGSTVVLGALSIVIITALSRWSMPIMTSDNTSMQLPSLFLFGFWIALVTAVVFLSIYARRITNETQSMGDALLATQLALAREQKLTELGGVVAAAAHELGTPLATIKLISNELIEELGAQPDLLDDVRLIREQSDRCRDILHSMGRAGKDDKHLRSAPFETVVHEAAEPHMDRGKLVLFDVGPDDDSTEPQPAILRRSEIIHGLRNLIQNAVDFAGTRVEIDIVWDDQHLKVRITDDGQGFPLSVIGRIGDPFVRRRSNNTEESQRPGYAGMGLGLFIAKTLLERTGAVLEFSNKKQNAIKVSDGEYRTGAVVTVSWQRGAIDHVASPQPLGQNEPILP